jgi:hypothetical protein
MTDVDQASPGSGVERMRAQVWQASTDLAAGRISAAQANRITKEAGRELRQVEAALRVAKLGRRLESQTD